jgi:phosphonopyruvate decarboxylase
MMLERTPALAALLADTDDRLIVTGLGSAANDIAYITDFAARAFTMDGVMGAAASVGLGLALAQPSREVLVVTGDGELLMNIGTLATIAVQNPQNLRIIVVDNGLYGLTGGQSTATSTVADLEVIAKGAGIGRTLTVRSEDDFTAARALIAAPGDTAFVLVKVAPGPAADVRIDRDGSRLRTNFRSYVLSEERP